MSPLICVKLLQNKQHKLLNGDFICFELPRTSTCFHKSLDNRSDILQQGEEEEKEIKVMKLMFDDRKRDKTNQVGVCALCEYERQLPRK